MSVCHVRAPLSAARYLLPAALAFAMCDASAQAYLPVVGGMGGSPFKALCPDGQILTGVRLHAGRDVDAVQALCGVPRGAAQVDVQPGPPAQGKARDGTLGGIGGWYGGPGGSAAEVRCPDKTPAVLAMTVGAEGEKTVIVNNIWLFCGVVSDAAQTAPQYPTAVFDAPAITGVTSMLPSLLPIPLPIDLPLPELERQRNGHYRAASYACPAGQIAIGMHGRYGIWVDGLGLVCGNSPLKQEAPVATIPSMGSGRSSNKHDSTTIEADTDAKAHLPQTIPSMGRARPSPVKATTVDAVQESRRNLDPPICAKARSARDRKSPAADSLARQCRDQGGVL